MRAATTGGAGVLGTQMPNVNLCKEVEREGLGRLWKFLEFLHFLVAQSRIRCPTWGPVPPSEWGGRGGNQGRRAMNSEPMEKVEGPGLTPDAAGRLVSETPEASGLCDASGVGTRGY